jgi:Xaa-Pro dipeptidase
MNLSEIQQQLREQNLDGWLFFDHHRRDPLAYRILGFNPQQHITRRWYYLIPAEGDPIGLVHRIESSMLSSLPGSCLQYSSWLEQVEGIKTLIGTRKKIAMQFSPLCAIPYVSLIDGGTIDLIRTTGVEVVTSAELVQYFEARLDQVGLETHLTAGKLIDRIRADAFGLIGHRLRVGQNITEYEVQQYVREQFSGCGLVTDSGPIVGADRNSGDPHYEPSASNSSTITLDSFVLLDMWAKLDLPGAIFYDITWTGYCGEHAPERFQKVFDVVTRARDAAIARVQQAVKHGADLRGFEVDDAARSIISAAGFSNQFTHRTGHSIGTNIHGNGANMDNLETHDERRIIPWTCFSIEPGVYLDDFGIRSEINLFVLNDSAVVTGEIQRELVRIV